MTRSATALLAITVTTLVALPAVAGAVPLTVTTASPQQISSSGATLRATLNLSDASADVSWQYGATAGYGATTLAVPVAGAGSAQTVMLAVTGLAAGTTYHVRAVATRGMTTVYGGDVAFTTAVPAGGSGSTSGGDSTSSGSGSGGAGDTTGTTAPSTSPATTTDAGGSTTTATTTTGTTTSADDGSGAVAAPAVATAALTAKLGRSVALATVRGRVTATTPSGRVVNLSTGRVLPVGTVIDTRAGAVELKSALDTAGGVQVARFWGGRFAVRQDARLHGLTELVLRGGDFSRCPSRAAAARVAATTTKKKSPPRALWGSDDHGRFETRGRGSVATVRGTRWLTEDRCAGTLTRVVTGAVAVRDLHRHRTVVVHKGGRYLARVS